MRVLRTKDVLVVVCEAERRAYVEYGGKARYFSLDELVKSWELPGFPKELLDVLKSVTSEKDNHLLNNQE